jgi:hypothetical protein
MFSSEEIGGELWAKSLSTRILINSLLAVECKAARGTVGLYEDKREDPIQCKGSSTLCPQVLSHLGPRHTYFLLPISDIIILVFISTSPRFAHIFPFLSPSSCRYPLTIPRSPTVAPSLDD